MLHPHRSAPFGRMPHDSPLKGYWDQANFKLVDTLNAEMWTRSPQLQREIQSPHDLIGTGKVGPQQAMLEPDAALDIKTDTVLPWVPDIVGKDADGDRGVIIFGAAYAGFIREYSSRRACLGLSDYAKAATNGNEANWTVSWSAAFPKQRRRPRCRFRWRLLRQALKKPYRSRAGRKRTRPALLEAVDSQWHS